MADSLIQNGGLSALPLVLDTNLARGASIERLTALAARGARLRIAESALLEWCAHAFGKMRDGWSRQRARSLFFERARRLRPVLDPSTPIALGWGLLAARVRASADGAPPVDRAVEHEEELQLLWRRISGVGMTDEEWQDAARDATAFLDDADRELFELLRREQALDASTQEEIAALEGARADELRAAHEIWARAPEAVKLEGCRAYLCEAWQLSTAAAERLDAQIRTTALRMREAARGARMPKINDGGDLPLTMHLGDGCILLVDDGALLDIIDLSGTFQAAWVRRLDDIDDLPDRPPWGEHARTFRFQRGG